MEWIDSAAERTPGKIVVYHTSYGCDTGCMGHTIEGDNRSEFHFDEPMPNDDFRRWAEDLIAESWGPEHVKDLDWEHCYISPGY